MEISIPVLYNGREGTVTITVLSNGKRNITVDINGNKMELTQNGEAKTTSSKGLIQGTLYKVLDERVVGAKRWKVRDFILNVPTIRGEQKRIVQASGEVIEIIDKIRLGTPLVCEVSFLGKEFNRGVDFVYRNLDEVSKLHIL